MNKKFINNDDLYRTYGAFKYGTSISQMKINKSFVYPKKKSKYARNFQFINQHSDKCQPELFFLK